jgi:hypothetical protein
MAALSQIGALYQRDSRHQWRSALSSVRSGRLIAAQQEGIRLAIQGGAHDLQMHEMRGATDLDVAFDPTGREGVEQPACVLVRGNALNDRWLRVRDLVVQLFQGQPVGRRSEYPDHGDAHQQRAADEHGDSRHATANQE